MNRKKVCHEEKDNHRNDRSRPCGWFYFLEKGDA
jgi:hypothetical protein